MPKTKLWRFKIHQNYREELLSKSEGIARVEVVPAGHQFPVWTHTLS